MIVCILFFSMDLSTALWTGIIVGMGYTMFVRAMYSQQVSSLSRLACHPHPHLHPVPAPYTL